MTYVAAAVVVCAAVAQAFMLIAFIVWAAGLVNAVAYGLMSRATVLVCAAILTAIGYLVQH